MTRSVAIVIESLGGGGAQHVATTLANAWAAQGVATTLITFQDAVADMFTLDPRVRRMVLGGNKPSSNLLVGLFANVGRVYSLRRAFRISNAAVVLSFVGATNVLAVLARSGLKQRLVISERNDPARQSLGAVWNSLRRLLYRRADLVVANSAAALETMSAYVPSGRLRWLPNPLRRPPDEPAAKIEIDSPICLAAGRLEPQKNFGLLIEAFAKLAPEFQDLHLAILGAGPMRDELQELAVQLGIGQRVHLPGYVANPFPWYRVATMFLHPARYEGMPNVVLEAMSEGSPVVVTDTQTGLRGFVRNGESGLVVRTGSAEEFTAAITRLVRDPDLCKRLSSAARDAVAPFHPEQALAAWTAAVFN